MQYFRRCTKGAAFIAAIGWFGCTGSTGLSGVSYGDGSGAAGSGDTGANASSGTAGHTSTETTTGASGTTTVVNTGSGTVTSLTFDVTTVPQGGRYAPKNVGAIWIEDSSGAYVRSLEVWAGIRKHDLRQYMISLAGHRDADVTTSATLRSHRTHEVTWNLKDSNGNIVAPGRFKLIIELTDSNSSGQSYSVGFDTSQGMQVITPATSPYYKSMSIKLQ